MQRAPVTGASTVGSGGSRIERPTPASTCSFRHEVTAEQRSSGLLETDQRVRTVSPPRVRRSWCRCWFGRNHPQGSCVSPNENRAALLHPYPSGRLSGIMTVPGCELRLLCGLFDRKNCWRTSLCSVAFHRPPGSIRALAAFQERSPVSLGGCCSRRFSRVRCRPTSPPCCPRRDFDPRRTRSSSRSACPLRISQPSFSS